MKAETYWTSDIGFGKAKKRTIHAFSNALWPLLSQNGWSQITDSTVTIVEGGAICVIPPGVDTSTSVRGTDYYDKMKQVIDRVLERRNPIETNAADAYENMMFQLEFDAGHRKHDFNYQLRAVTSCDTNEISPENRWKEERTLFPKCSSRLGDEYQVSSLPHSSLSYEMDVGIMYDQIWDPERAVECGCLSYIHEHVPSNKRETAFVLLHENRYDTCDFLQQLERTPRPSDCSQWTQQDKDSFHRLIYEFRKDLRRVAQSMNKSFSSCYCYFLSTYKKMNDYRLLKIICKQIKEMKDQEETCVVCKDGGNLIVCECCESAFHLSCLRPPLQVVPEGDWLCDYCVYERLLQARSFLLDSTSFSQAWARGLSDNNTPNDMILDHKETTMTEAHVLDTGDRSTARLENSAVAIGPSPHSALQKFISGFVAIMET